MTKTYRFRLTTLDHPNAHSICQDVLKQYYDVKFDIKKTSFQCEYTISLKSKNETDVMNWHKNFNRIKRSMMSSHVPHMCNATVLNADQEIEYEKTVLYTADEGLQNLEEKYAFTALDKKIIAKVV